MLSFSGKDYGASLTKEPLTEQNDPTHQDRTRKLASEGRHQPLRRPYLGRRNLFSESGINLKAAGRIDADSSCHRSPSPQTVDSTTPGGKLVFYIFGTLAEFERNLIRERTRAGLEAARARGRKGGRPKRLNAQQRSLAVDLFRQKKLSISEICEARGITKPTLYAYVREAAANETLTA